MRETPFLTLGHPEKVKMGLDISMGLRHAAFMLFSDEWVPGILLDK